MSTLCNENLLIIHIIINSVALPLPSTATAAFEISLQLTLIFKLIKAFLTFQPQNIFCNYISLFLQQDSSINDHLYFEHEWQALSAVKHTLLLELLFHTSSQYLEVTGYFVTSNFC